jgi:hypothetical protein
MLLKEQITFNEAQCIVEAEDSPDHKGKKLFMRGIFIQGGVRNFNERVYPVREIQKAVESINSQLKTQDILGELDHPEELTINLDRVSHNIVEMWMDGNNGMGKLRILNTPSGNIARTLIESDIKLGVSSRGVGNVDDNGEVSGFEMITLDLVCRPSAPMAYPKPIYESLNAKRGKIIEDLATAVQHDYRARKYLKEEMLGWIRQLKA